MLKVVGGSWRLAPGAGIGQGTDEDVDACAVHAEVLRKPRKSGGGGQEPGRHTVTSVGWNAIGHKDTHTSTSKR
jgi:hypothetical protein